MSCTTCFEVKTSSSGLHISKCERWNTCSILGLFNILVPSISYSLSLSVKPLITNIGPVWRSIYLFFILTALWLFIVNFILIIRRNCLCQGIRGYTVFLSSGWSFVNSTDKKSLVDRGLKPVTFSTTQAWSRRSYKPSHELNQDPL